MIRSAPLKGNLCWFEFGKQATPSAVLELIERLEAAEKDAAIGNWLCNYMASPNIEHDDYLIEACREDNPEKFKLAVIELMKDKS